ncbi:MAG: response regulator [Candidatus Aminicenantes bacterium]|nr:response regulator [Candidatus Aminicenantes bacterium]
MSRSVILVVDGDRTHRETVSGFLRQAGYEVLAAGDGAAGWRVFLERRPDAVVVDMLLPEVSGFDLRRRIGQEAGPDRVPVVLMSELKKQAEWITEPCRSEQRSLTISKPVSRKELLSVLSDLTRTSSAPDPAPPDPAPGEPSPESDRKTPPDSDNIVTFPEPKSRSGPRRMLLADDNPVTRQIVRRAFEAQDFRVDIAADGKEASAHLAGPPHDIVLLDINLPGRNGYELFAEIRRNPSLDGTAVVFLKEPFEKVDETKLQACAADGLIHKPLKSADWVRTVKDLLNKRALRSSRL